MKKHCVRVNRRVVRSIWGASFELAYETMPDERYSTVKYLMVFGETHAVYVKSYLGLGETQFIQAVTSLFEDVRQVCYPRDTWIERAANDIGTGFSYPDCAQHYQTFFRFTRSS